MRILVVEDDAVLAAALTRALTQAAYVVDLVEDGERASEALRPLPGRSAARPRGIARLRRRAQDCEQALDDDTCQRSAALSSGYSSAAQSRGIAWLRRRARGDKSVCFIIR